MTRPDSISHIKVTTEFKNSAIPANTLVCEYIFCVVVVLFKVVMYASVIRFFAFQVCDCSSEMPPEQVGLIYSPCPAIALLLLLRSPSRRESRVAFPVHSRFKLRCCSKLFSPLKISTNIRPHYQQTNNTSKVQTQSTGCYFR